MKKILMTVAIVASFGVAGCASNTSWTAWDAGRTAGHGGTNEVMAAPMKAAPMKQADNAFSGSLRK